MSVECDTHSTSFVQHIKEKGDFKEGRIHPLCAEGKHLMVRMHVSSIFFPNLVSMLTSLLQLKLSHEHSGWTFEKDPNKSAELLAVHSGGTGATALRMSMALGGTGMEEMKLIAEKTDDQQQLNVAAPEKEPDTETPAAARAPPVDLLSPPEELSIWTKLFTCCNWYE